jgi:hypothetical protein
VCGRTQKCKRRHRRISRKFSLLKLGSIARACATGLGVVGAVRPSLGINFLGSDKYKLQSHGSENLRFDLDLATVPGKNK